MLLEIAPPNSNRIPDGTIHDVGADVSVDIFRWPKSVFDVCRRTIQSVEAKNASQRFGGCVSDVSTSVPSQHTPNDNASANENDRTEDENWSVSRRHVEGPIKRGRSD